MSFPVVLLREERPAPAAPPPEPRASVRSQTSDAVTIARVICILGVVYVHAWTGLTGPELAAVGSSGQGMLRWTLAELLGRAAVPLLSMISGWLAAGSLARRPWPAFLRGKARTVLAPMVLWNALAILLVGGAASLGLIAAPRPTGWAWTLNELFCLTKPDDIDVQMPFLRDLTVCLALAPVLARLETRLLAAVAVFVLAWSVWDVQTLLLLRPSILLFFVLGLLARRSGAPRWVAGRSLVWLGAPYLALAGASIWLQTGGQAFAAAWPPAAEALGLAMRFSAALFFWALAWRLAASRVAEPLLRLEPFIFLLFCAHMIVIWLAGPQVGRLTGPLGAPLYPLFLLAQPVLVLGAVVALGRGLRRLTPGAAELLSGGRLRRRAPDRALSLVAAANTPNPALPPSRGKGS
ncbi:acyltransferase family protein [Phenylobacterium montanum]|uniref:Acyltransferase n=1 Tax=Phenylobacterium montanum TaxID=2823693 RepID=A0A975ITU3_9CAUL|nr:acyltransferase [Caulobacter sp. S6]QUD86834.1 acyltransferase [Caulobacter sp. S6]